MPAQRMSMRKINEVLRLCWGNGLSKRKTAMCCGISRPAVDEYLRRAEEAGLGRFYYLIYSITSRVL